jgi:predicted nucleotidyltransferase
MRPDQLQLLLAELKQQLQEALGSNMVELILFGSYARGDSEPDPDIDFILLLREKPSRAEEMEISQISSRLSLKYDTVIVCFDYLAEDFQNKTSLLIRNVKREGIRL